MTKKEPPLYRMAPFFRTVDLAALERIHQIMESFMVGVI